MSLSHHPNIVRNGLVAYFDAANPKSYPAGQDPYVNNVSLMLSMDGANNSTTFIDSSQNALAVTAVADAKISTAQSKFGGSAAYFDGTGDYLTVASNAAIAFGLGDFTIECWVNFSALPTTNTVMGIANTMALTNWGGLGLGEWVKYWWFGLEDSGGTKRLRLGRHGNGDVYAYVNWTPSLNTWYHITATRSSSSVIKLFIDGVSQSVTTSGANWANDFSATGSLVVGYVVTLATFNGYIDEFRLTKGVARYTASFTPPSAPFSLPGRITDLTTNKIIGTLTNGPTYSGGSLVFDGTNDYVKAPFSSNYNFGSGNFTVSAWINMTVLPSNNWSSFVTHGVSGSAQRWVFYYDTRTSQSSPGLRFTSVNASNAANIDISVGSTSGWSAGVWYYVTITRVGNVFTLYRNGVQVGNTVTDADAIIDVTSNGLYLGMENTGVDAPLNGKISLVQIYKGKGLSSSEILQNYNATKSRYG